MAVGESKKMPANIKKPKTATPSPQDNEKKDRKWLFTVLTIVAVIVVVAAVIGGVFYYIIRNNINGMAEHYRTTIQGIPVLRNALPKAVDPLDPKNMTQSQIIEKYKEFREENSVLKQQLEEANAKIKEYQAYKDEQEQIKLDIENQKQELNDREIALARKEKELDELKKQLDILAANGDKEGFKEYFEKIDPETAKQLYSDVTDKLQIDANVKKFAQIYAEMDAGAAARIFEQLGSEKIDMTAETLKAMSKDDASEILESMNPEFAAKLTEKLNELYRGN